MRGHHVSLHRRTLRTGGRPRLMHPLNRTRSNVVYLAEEQNSLNSFDNPSSVRYLLVALLVLGSRRQIRYSLTPFPVCYPVTSSLLNKVYCPLEWSLEKWISKRGDYERRISKIRNVPGQINYFQQRNLELSTIFGLRDEFQDHIWNITQVHKMLIFIDNWHHYF